MKRVEKKAKPISKKKSKRRSKAERAARASGPRNSPAKAKAKKSAKPNAQAEPAKVPLSLKSDVTKSPSELIDKRIVDVAGWRGAMLGRIRGLIREAVPAVTEEWKWEVPVWSHDGIVCTGEVYQNVVKLTFAHGASVEDPSNLFNSSLQGNTRRAIDIHEGDNVDAEAFKALFRAAAARNSAAKGS